MANSNICESGKGRRDDEEMRGLSETECESEHGAAVLGRSGIEIMGNTNDEGLEGRNSRVSEKCSRERTSGANGPFAPEQQWPSRPGQPQHEWEAPRLESSLGYAINGYNFREDLLRMAGNAVVEQTAEFAFRTLIQKFL